MPTTGNIPGKLILLYVSTDGGTNYDAAGCQQNGAFTIGTDTIEAICKNGGAWSDALVSTKNWSATLDAFIAFDHVLGAKEFIGYIINDTVLDVKFTSDVTGDPEWGGTCICTNFDANFDVGDFATYTVNLLGKGAPVIGSVA